MQYDVSFYGPKPDGKRQRIGRGSVDAPNASAALKAAHDLLGKAPADVQKRVNETRIAETSTDSFRWTKARTAPKK